MTIEIKKIDDKRSVIVIPKEDDAYLIDKSPIGVTTLKKFPKETILELIDEIGKSKMKKLGDFLEVRKNISSKNKK